MSRTRSSATAERRRDPLLHAIAGLTWILPVATIAFVAYVAGALVGGIRYDLPIWLVLLPSIPSLVITWIALVVALVDVTGRPASQLSDSARLAWLVVLALLNVLAFLPYWLVVARHPLPRTPA